jgi:hypothetical protein
LESSNKREQASIDKAAENARLFTAEVKLKLKASIQDRERSVAHG